MHDRFDLSNVDLNTLTPSGRVWTWWRDDPLPSLEPLEGLTVDLAEVDAALASLNRVSLEEVQRRAATGNRVYLGRLHGEPIAYGWVATQKGAFWQDRIRFPVPCHSRYLWDFETLPDWRGRGIYSRLLQAILVAEPPEAERFWILHQWANTASQRGIQRAGFQRAGALYLVPNRRMGVAPTPPGDRGKIGAKFLRLPTLPPEQP